MTLITLPGRDTPELPPRTLFSGLELVVFGGFRYGPRAAQPDNLGRAVRTTARLGGYLNRKHEPAPGNQIMWEDYTRLATVDHFYERLIRLDQTSNLYQSPPSATSGG